MPKSLRESSLSPSVCLELLGSGVDTAACLSAREEGQTVESRAALEAEIVRKCLARKDNQVRMPSHWP